MIALQIKNIKTFMAKLLGTECFDVFLLEEAVISTYNTFTIDGRQNRDFYTGEEWDDAEIRPYAFSRWKDVRGICFSLIKGKHTPCGFKFVFQLIPDKTAEMLGAGEAAGAGHIKAFVLTVRYDENGLVLITGTSMAAFVPDKTADIAWDHGIRLFLDRYGIEYEEK